MRPILAVGILLLGLNSAAPEPEYSSLFAGNYVRFDAGDGTAALVEIESSTGRGDRLTTSSEPRELLRRGSTTGSVTLASADPDLATDSIAATDDNANRPTDVSLGELCNALFSSAQSNDLPVPFFANLIWQESRLHPNDVSEKGAMGIAQFMPDAALDTGLDNPFDPLEAIPASARLLQRLRLQFGNLGFVAAAYNAGPRRVIDWLQHRRKLPQETRTYVVRVTGLSIDAWRSMAVTDDALTFVGHLPCRSLPVFANVEQAQVEQAALVHAKWEETKARVPIANAAATHAAAKNSAANKILHQQAPKAAHDQHAAKREAVHAPNTAHDKRKSA
jgi:Transglycosylase SLT domain